MPTIDLPETTLPKTKDGTTYISSKQLCQLTGGTYRQIDYWCRSDVIPTIGEARPGSGFTRYHDYRIVEAVKVLVRVSQALSHNPSPGILKKVFEKYELGHIYLGEGITLSWEKPEKNHLV